MESKILETDKMPKEADYHGNNAAVTCPVCGKIFVVSKLIDKGKRVCPVCGKATASISEDGKQVKVEW